MTGYILAAILVCAAFLLLSHICELEQFLGQEAISGKAAKRGMAG